MRRTDLLARVVASTDNSIYQVLPAAIATPSDAREVSTLLATNERSDHPLPVVARGGGTGTNGQSLTDGLVVDLKQRMHHIDEIDPANRIAIVEPGVVAAALNRRAAEHGLFWAPHTSTLNRATVGGMIATDAAGKGSLVHGRTHRHVAALDLCLADGSIVHLAPTAIDDARRRASQDDAEGRLWRALLAISVHEGIGPPLARSWTGYGLDRFRSGDVFDPVQLVVGAEGTLGIVTRAWLHLTPLPTATRTVVAVYDSFDDALADSLDLAATRPAAIEAIDETTLHAARSSPSWPTLDAIVGERPGALLLLDYEDRDELAAELVRPVRSSGRCRAAEVIDDGHGRRAAWTVRADAVGLLARRVVRSIGSDDEPLAARPTAMVEDCAVPVAELGAFISGFRRLLDEAGLEYGMFGHADVGCVHVRPALDLTDPAHEQLVDRLTSDVVELVAAHGGVLWGEHGRGFRGASVDQVLSPDQILAMRAVKQAFDPNDRCNPGKLYRPSGSGEALVGVADPLTRGGWNRRIPVAVRAEHHSAFACNGNGLCHDLEAAAPMCPSYQATGDPTRSPKGRADLVRAWLAGRHGMSDGATSPFAEERFANELAANLDECLSCAACSGRCPVEVDVPELKSQFLHAYHRDRRRPVADHVLGRFERLAPILARTPRLTRVGSRPIGRLLGLVDLPTPPRTGRTIPRIDPRRRAVDADYVVLADVFTSVLEPATLFAAVDALAATGASVAATPLVPSGKFDHVKGRRHEFRGAVARQHELVDAVLAGGARPVVIEPAVALLHRHEYCEVDPTHRGDEVWSLADALEGAIEMDGRRPTAAEPKHLTLMGHCTERARRPEQTSQWHMLLESAGHTVETMDTGCCGMAGVFGHERSNQEMSIDLWQRNWQPVVDRTDPGRLLATGYSCRSQAARLAGVALAHPVLELVGTRRHGS